MRSVREAKDFLASEIAEEAQREGTPFSEIERKMLYFSETGWTLPDMMKVYEEFDSTYGQDEYERKIARLIRGAYRRACRDKTATYEKWHASIKILNKGDHYLSVMIRLAGLRPRHDQLKLFLTAMAIVAVMISGILLSIKYNIPFGSHPSGPKSSLVHTSLSEYLWAGMVVVFVVYQLLRLVLGPKRADDVTSKVLRALARFSNRIS
jgi:hypothetical protein